MRVLWYRDGGGESVGGALREGGWNHVQVWEEAGHGDGQDG